MSRQLMPAIAAILALTFLLGGSGSVSLAQSRGFGSFEINRLNRTAVGVGYSIDDINRRTVAQSYARAPLTGVGGVDGTSRAPIATPRAPSLGLSNSRPTNRPFSNLNRRPTVSPYLLLDTEFDTDPNGAATRYQTLVRPQIEQRRRDQQLQSEVMQLNARLQNIAAQPSQNPQGSQSLAPTGSPSTFRYYSHFYPGKGGRR